MITLRIGNRLTGITVEPDNHWPGMWHIRRGNGPPSDMLNLTRAKDAALSWATPADGGLGSRQISWVAILSSPIPNETVRKAPPMR